MRSIVIVLLVVACNAPVPAKPGWDPDVAPILEANCVRCHTAANAAMVLGSEPAPSCVELDIWDSTAASGACQMILGVHDSAMTIVSDVMSGRMPKDGPALTDREKQILQAWMADGFLKRATNQPPQITFITPPASGATINTGGVTTYDIQYDVTDADNDTVTWSLAYSGSNGKSGTFATSLSAGTGTVHADTSPLGTGTYQLIATLDDGFGPVMATAPGMLTVPAGYNAAPTVGMLSPAGGEYFYVTQTITVSWVGNDDGASVTCDVVATAGTTTVTIATNVSESAGQMASVMWNLASVTPANYQIKVTVHETDGTQTASATSGTFTVSPPPQNVSFSTQIAPLFQSSTMNMDGCTKTGCHGSTMPQQGLSLTSSTAYASIVNVQSTECASEKLILPGAPDQSYLITKLVGSGTCFSGSIMPKGEAAYTTTDIQLLRDWTFNGAPNN